MMNCIRDVDTHLRQRREFLRALIATAASTAAGSLAGCAGQHSHRPSAGELAQFDALATAEAISARRLTPLEATDAAITRARQMQPLINAVTVPAYDRARYVASGPLSGPFAGVPTFIKDLDDVRGLPTRFGSRAFDQTPAKRQSPYVDALERAGLVFLGKSSTPEFGLTGSTEPLLHGPTRNPWHLDYSPGGSSGGAAALVAARVVPVAHATDGAGSIRIPASCCGVFGLKPSRGRTLSTNRPAGPVDIGVSHVISMSVRDSALWLAATERGRGAQIGEPVGFVSAATTRQLRIALDLEPLLGNTLDPQVRAAIEDTARRCETLGHRVEIAPLPLPKPRLLDAFLIYWASGAARIADDLETHLGRAVTDAELEPWTLGLRDYFRARRHRLDAAVAQINSTVEVCERFHHDYDVLLTPTATRLPFRIGELSPMLPFETHRERALGYVGFTPVQNAAGTPAMSVPLHWSDEGLPIGSQFAARAGDERTLLALAYQLEAAFPWAHRRPDLALT